jgi:hypothetical protein
MPIRGFPEKVYIKSAPHASRIDFLNDDSFAVYLYPENSDDENMLVGEYTLNRVRRVLVERKLILEEVDE